MGVMRGGGGGGMIRPPFKKFFIPRHPFDLIQAAESSFPKVVNQSTTDETNLTNALLKRNQDLTPTAAEQAALTNLVSKVQTCLDNLVVAPGEFNTCVRYKSSYCLLTY